jgi:hypothetical protein
MTLRSTPTRCFTRGSEWVLLLLVGAALACTPPAEPNFAPTVSAPPPADTAFFAEGPAYASAPVATSAAAAHLAKKVSVSMPAVPACLTCHKGGGRGAAFLFAGTIFSDKAATRGAADVEIRVVDAKGVATTVHSDADGNFWSKGATSLAKPARVGARNAQVVRVQRDSISTGDCNSCHTTTLPLVF